jgi:hypothetical protein
MSPAMLLELRTGFAERIKELGQKFRLLKDGSEWDGILLGVPPMDPQLELGSDWREMATLESLRQVTPSIGYGDLIKQVSPFWSIPSDPQTVLWKVVRREDNGAYFTIKFWLVMVTQKDPDYGTG